MFKQKKALALFLVPGLTLTLVFYVIPFMGGIWYSLTDGTINNRYVGFVNYNEIWKNTMFQLGLKNTVELSVIGAPLLWVMSFFLALVLSAIRPHGSFFRTTALMPYLMPSSAVLLIWLVLFDYGGPLNRLVEILGIPRVFWLESENLRIPILIMFLWKNLGFCMVIFLAALQAIPVSLYEYALLEGAGFFRRAFTISLPLIMPTAFLVFILSWMSAFKIFREVYFIAGSYPDKAVYTLQHYMNNMFSRLNYPYVTAAAYSFSVMVLTLFGVVFYLQRRTELAFD